MVFQRSHLLPHRSTAENILFRFRYADVPARETQAATERVMESLGLRDLRDRPVRLLSAGEMQRVAIARAVVLQPRLLLADEPTGNLDRESSGRVMDCFRTLNRQGITVLMVTHNEGLLEYGGRHLMCRNGTLVQGA
jgi:putative ABC transport system ATP-binding protein